MTQSLGHSRRDKWDILKCLLIFCVVLGHAADYYTADSASMRCLFLFIYSFHMPLFIFISGLFSKRTVNDLRISKISGFLLLYVALKMTGWFFNPTAFRLELFTESGLPWYMLVMFLYPIITHPLRNIKPPYVLIISLLFAVIAGFDSNINDFLALSRLIVFFPFYYLGYISDADKLESFTKKTHIRLISVVIILAFAATVILLSHKIYILRYLFSARNPYSSLGNYAARAPLLRLICYLISFLMGFSLIALTPRRAPKLITKIGQRSLSVYFYHTMVLHILYITLNLRGVLAASPLGDSGYLIIPITLILTYIFSLKLFDAPIRYILKLPEKAKKLTD